MRHPVLRQAFDALHSAAVAVWHLQRVLAKKRDPLSHTLFLDALESAGADTPLEHFWCASWLPCCQSCSRIVAEHYLLQIMLTRMAKIPHTDLNTAHPTREAPAELQEQPYTLIARAVRMTIICSGKAS